MLESQSGVPVSDPTEKSFSFQGEQEAVVTGTALPVVSAFSAQVSRTLSPSQCLFDAGGGVVWGAVSGPVGRAGACIKSGYEMGSCDRLVKPVKNGECELPKEGLSEELLRRVGRSDSALGAGAVGQGECSDLTISKRVKSWTTWFFFSFFYFLE